MITKFKIFEEYEASIDDFKNIEVGDILIAKCDVYIDYPNKIQKNYRSTELSNFGDKLFVLKGKTKKVTKIDYEGIHLSGFSIGQSIRNLHRLFNIKNGELKTSMRKYNL